VDPDELTPQLVRRAYEEGAFPMTMEDGLIEWFQPYARALFPVVGMRVSRSLARTIRRGEYEVRFDTCFEEVMRACMRPEDNWISEPLIRVYTEIHRQGWAHCCEAWADGELAGGVYGLALGACFCAESMFHRRRDASKVALWALIERCRALGFEMFDAQVMSPHLATLGAFEVTHERYMTLLRGALLRRTAWSG
jgi:leucyl/phenylalanyl-tRNA--protein transferase